MKASVHWGLNMGPALPISCASRSQKDGGASLTHQEAEARGDSVAPPGSHSKRRQSLAEASSLSPELREQNFTESPLSTSQAPCWVTGTQRVTRVPDSEQLTAKWGHDWKLTLSASMTPINTLIMSPLNETYKSTNEIKRLSREIWKDCPCSSLDWTSPAHRHHLRAPSTLNPWRTWLKNRTNWRAFPVPWLFEELL